jgi:hypothetical protein
MATPTPTSKSTINRSESINLKNRRASNRALPYAKKSVAVFCIVLHRRQQRENLTSDDKGKGTSGVNREAESTDALGRGGLPRSSVEAA